ncbi:MAG: hypothetical protein CMJ78_02105 [Planctomycetaceae bacterium]|nr:hypothetical protein [Planctomycetaceae bacterium]
MRKIRKRTAYGEIENLIGGADTGSGTSQPTKPLDIVTVYLNALKQQRNELKHRNDEPMALNTELTKRAKDFEYRCGARSLCWRVSLRHVIARDEYHPTLLAPERRSTKAD